MQINASKLSSQIVYAHMQNIALKKSDLFVDKGFKFALYDEKGVAVLSYIAQKVILNRKFSKNKNNLILIDNSVGGHLGISYIAIEETVLHKTLQDLREKIVISFILFYFLISVFSYSLTKLFIKPIVQQRIKLNNFIKDTTHELNTPISALIMSVNSQTPLNDNALKRISISAKRISEIYNDLTYLFLNNIQDIKAKATLIDLKPILDEQLEYFNLFASKKRIQLSYHSESTPFVIDKESFTRISNNLISNAIKYTHSNGSIQVELKNKRLIIKDTGCGINKEDLKKIFTRFYRATEITGGFGIGLNIVSSICKEYDIQLDVQSELGQGSTFTLYFNNP
ncbi:MAG: sensor histidine kinase [Candidatus Marinarcus sp.]|uniref:sensor histidine kinase n=1 Tax=Candidatus Marinarcus sp. TaxID=3100987 RepID=UPI003AFF71E6